MPDLNKYSDRSPVSDAVGIGRNVSLFDTVRKWAYTEIRLFRGEGRKHYATWLTHVYDKVAERNGDFTEPLGLSEVKAISRSIGNGSGNVTRMPRISLFKDRPIKHL